MNALAVLQQRFIDALTGMVQDPAAAASHVRPSQDPKFGDYQANCAMPLQGELKKKSREIAEEIVARLSVDDLCHPPEIAGPGFINLTLRDDWLTGQLAAALPDERLGVAPVAEPKTYVVDFSAPNVAKPMHVGHIRSTVIGDSLVRTLRFVGHRVISDNHIGDWGTQFGMIIYGYRHFLDADAYQKNPVAELARLYRLVRQLMDYHAALKSAPQMQADIQQREADLATAEANTPADAKETKKHKKQLNQQRNKLDELRDELSSLDGKIRAVDDEARLAKVASEHAQINQSVLQETAKLHAGDAENKRLWEEFMPACLQDIERIYQRLDVTFDETLGESFYHDMLPGVVAELREKGLARESEGAVCVFIPGQDVPFIVQKSDGAYLYATTDLATIRHRMQTWNPDAILYVVDFRQGLHFENLFAGARMCGYQDVELVHVSFGTVLGDDGKPFRTRTGDTVGLEGLLDEAVSRARRVVDEVDEKKKGGPQFSAVERGEVAETIGISAIKYADLSQNRTSDYKFSYDKMVALDGNTATYMQYAYARCRNIFSGGDIDVDSIRSAAPALTVGESTERALALKLLQFEESLDTLLADYRPNQLTSYLYDLATLYARFYENCPVLKADTPELRDSRLALCDLTARTIQKGLELLGIRTVERM